MVVEDPATIGAAMNERRALLKSTANGSASFLFSLCYI
jgi:hypothetical protein